MENFIDTHAHLSGEISRGNLASVLARATGAGVKRTVCSSTSPSDWHVYSKAATEFPDALSWQIGIHPEDIAPESEGALGALASFFTGSGETPQPVAIGEIGLDYFHLPECGEKAERAISLQKEILRKQLLIASQLDCKVCIHARSKKSASCGRNAVMDCSGEIERADVKFSNVVFHCYAGTPGELSALNEAGARASFTGIITFKNSEEMRQALKRQGLDLLMLETDSPFLSPSPLRGKPNEPANIPLIAKAAAEILGADIETVARKTTENAEEFFRLK